MQGIYRYALVIVLLLGFFLSFATYVGARHIQGDQASAGAIQQPPRLFPFPQEFKEQAARSGNTKHRAYANYAKITDDFEMLTVQVPADWRDIETGTWTYQQQQAGLFIAAATRLDGLYARRAESGMFMGVTRVLAPNYNAADLLDLERAALDRACVYKGRRDYADMFYSGYYDYYVRCANGGHNMLVAAATPGDQSFLILLRINVVHPADLEAATRIFETFEMSGATFGTAE